MFPLLITAMTSHVSGRAEAARVATRLAAHVISAGGAAALGLLYASEITRWEGVGQVVFPFGCVLLLGLQFTRLRHPPAMASGGAVLCGTDPVAVIGYVVVTAAVLFAEPLLRRVWRMAV